MLRFYNVLPTQDIWQPKAYAKFMASKSWLRRFDTYIYSPSKVYMDLEFPS